MKDMLFLHIRTDAQDPQKRIVRNGVVRAPLGPDTWLLRFHGPGFAFNMAAHVSQLGDFVFFDSLIDQQAYLADLFPRPVPAAGEAPPATTAETRLDIPDKLDP